MAINLKVRLQNDTGRGVSELKRELTATMQSVQQVGHSAAGMWSQDEAQRFRRELSSISAELREISQGLRQTTQVSEGLRDQGAAAQELNATARQTVIINQEQSTSFADVAMAALNAYLRFRLLNSAVQGGQHLWKNHRQATIAGGAAIGGIGVAAAGAFAGLMLLQAGLNAVRAVAQGVSDTIAFMREHGINNIQELTDASDNLAAAWFNLKRAALESDTIRRLTSTAAEGLNDTAGTIRLVQELVVELKRDLDLKDAAGSWERLRDWKRWEPVAKGLHALGEDTIGWLSIVDSRARGLQTLLNFSGVKADRSEIAAANARTRADAEQAEVRKWLAEFDRKEAKDAVAANRAKYESITDVNAAIGYQRELMKDLADGTDGSRDRIKAAQEELSWLLDERKRKQEELAHNTERIRQVERTGEAETIRAKADELKTLDEIREAQAEIVRVLREKNAAGKLEREDLANAQQLFQAYEQRKTALIQERTKAEQEYQKTLEEVARINADVMRQRADAVREAAEKQIAELRAAIAEAKGVLHPEQSLTDELQGQFSKKDVGKNIIAERQRAAREQRLEELRGEGKVDQNGKAIGETTAERQANQLALTRELKRLERQIEADTRRQLVAGGRGKIPAIDAAEERAARQRLLGERADKAVADLRLSPQARQQLQAQLDQENQQWIRQRELGGQVQQVRGLLGPQGRQDPRYEAMRAQMQAQANNGPVGAQAAQQGFAGMSDLARAQQGWGQQVTQTAGQAAEDAAAARTLFEQLSRTLGAQGQRLQSANRSTRR